jgi:hypothetical protein
LQLHTRKRIPVPVQALQQKKENDILFTMPIEKTTTTTAVAAKKITSRDHDLNRCGDDISKETTTPIETSGRTKWNEEVNPTTTNANIAEQKHNYKSSSDNSDTKSKPSGINTNEDKTSDLSSSVSSENSSAKDVNLKREINLTKDDLNQRFLSLLLDQYQMDRIRNDSNLQYQKSKGSKEQQQSQDEKDVSDSRTHKHANLGDNDTTETSNSYENNKTNSIDINQQDSNESLQSNLKRRFSLIHLLTSTKTQPQADNILAKDDPVLFDESSEELDYQRSYTADTIKEIGGITVQSNLRKRMSLMQLFPNTVNQLEDEYNSNNSCNDNDTGTVSGNRGAVEIVLDLIEQNIPVAEPNENILDTKNHELRSKWLYKGALQQVQWQRDNYLIGTAYANQRKVQRSHESHYDSQQTILPNDYEKQLTIYSLLFQQPKFTKTESYGQRQIADRLASFVPTPTVQSALLPYVTKLPNQLYSDLIQPNFIQHLMYSQQDTLNTTVINQLIRFLQNQQFRNAIKRSMIRAIPIVDNVPVIPPGLVPTAKLPSSSSVTAATQKPHTVTTQSTTSSNLPTGNDKSTNEKNDIAPKRKWRLRVPERSLDDDDWTDDGYQ